MTILDAIKAGLHFPYKSRWLVWEGIFKVYEFKHTYAEKITIIETADEVAAVAALMAAN